MVSAPRQRWVLRHRHNKRKESKNVLESMAAQKLICRHVDIVMSERESGTREFLTHIVDVIGFWSFFKRVDLVPGHLVIVLVSFPQLQKVKDEHFTQIPLYIVTRVFLGKKLGLIWLLFIAVFLLLNDRLVFFLLGQSNKGLGPPAVHQ